MLSLDFTPCKVDISILEVENIGLEGLDLVEVKARDW